jgi:predicted MFS family arabinose efflux permease
MENAAPPSDLRRERWLVLALMSILLYGIYYAFNAVVPLADAIIKQFGISRAQYGLLFSYYSVPNFIIVLIGGMLIDKIGTRKAGLLFVTLCVVGITLTAAALSFPLMLAGRFLYGIGAESLLIAEIKILARWFRGKELSFAFGINVTAVRLSDVSAINLGAHLPGWTGSMRMALWVTVAAVLIGCAAFLVYLRLDRRKKEGWGEEVKDAPADRIVFRDVFKYPTSYWYVSFLCLAFYSMIFPFVAFSSMFLQKKFGLSPGQAGFYGSFVYIATAVITPLFGLFLDRVGKRATIMLFGSLIIVPCHLGLGLTRFSPLLPMVGLGVSFSLVASALWPSLPLLIEEKRLGTAFGLTTLIQNVGLTLFPWAAGKLTDRAGGDYRNSLLMFAGLGVAAVILSVLLRLSARKGPSSKIELPTRLAQSGFTVSD